MASLRSLRVFVLASALTSLAACGGKSGAHPPVSAVGTTHLSIAWPARFRAIQAPGSALSMTAQLFASDLDSSKTLLTADRPATVKPTVASYSWDVPIPPGPARLWVRFYAEPEGKGSVVGVAFVDLVVDANGALLMPDGSAFSDLQLLGTVESVSVLPPARLVPGRTVDLEVQARSNQGLLALSPGSVSLALTSGAGVLRLNGGPSVTALAAGSATVVATVDGKTSEPVQIAVGAPSFGARSLVLQNNALVYDARGRRLWAALRTGTPGGDSVVSIDPETGSVGRSIPVGGDPSVLAISDDGSTMYVGQESAGTIRKVDLIRLSAGRTFAVGRDFGPDRPDRAIDIAVQPGSNSTIAVSAGSPADSGIAGPFVFDGGVRRPNNPGLSRGERLAFASPTRLLATNLYVSPNSIYDYALDAAGLTLRREERGTIGTSPTGLQLSEGRVYTSEGQAFDAETLDLLGTFALDLQSASRLYVWGPAIDGQRGRAYFVRMMDGKGFLDEYRTDTFERVGSHEFAGVDLTDLPIGEDRSDLLRWGDSGLAFRTRSRVIFLDDVPRD